MMAELFEGLSEFYEFDKYKCHKSMIPSAKVGALENYITQMWINLGVLEANGRKRYVIATLRVMQFSILYE
jgi:hypothetical protein